jgi:Thaumarchaeal output domain 1
MSPAAPPSAPLRLFDRFGSQSKTRARCRTRLLALPGPVDDTALGAGVVQASQGEHPDVVLLTQPNAAHLLATVLCPGIAAVVPVVDASGLSPSRAANDSRADVHVRSPNRSSLANALTMLAPMAERMRSLPTATLESSDSRINLLARLMIRDRGMEPRRDPSARTTVAFTDERAIPGAANCASELVALGFLEPQFFDTVTVCPHCDSGRLCVRERCPACGSTHLLDEPVIHHLRCAYQAPEHEFRQPSGMTCPKCRASLLHFSVDYDRPGSVAYCRACAHVSGETAVGFLCLDCGAEIDAPDVPTREIHRYELTSAAHDCLSNALPLPAPTTKVDTTVYRIREFAARQAASGRPSCVLAVELEAAPDKARGRSFQQTHSLVSSLMRETFTPETEIVESAPRFFALLANDTKADVEHALPEIRAALETFLSSRIPIHYRVYAADEIERIVEECEPTAESLERALV